MKIHLTPMLAGVAALVMAGGCTRSSAARHRQPRQTAGVRPSAAMAEEGSQDFEIRILGVDPGDCSTVALDVAQVTASANGTPLTVIPGLARVDLENPDQAYLVGTVQVPVGTDAIDLSVTFDDAGWYACRTEPGFIDARHVTLGWHAPVVWLQQRGHTVIELDVARSLVARPTGGEQLVPDFKVAY